ncbi:hypothetical protein FHS19_003106 [Paenibacillus rhizosphaerae]|uniref:Uncharacterized protein n=1 Tax=Paenibacillus rhizosphaerae TaxID=297318 RepID=A0A839TP38_9BACL|nr:hypothetical protein [Paenibacillus rhizosphaerae]MBB3128452.1 hypothetical protein [Paenibacillus rhizosphaerae]
MDGEGRAIFRSCQGFAVLSEWPHEGADRTGADFLVGSVKE